MKRGSTMRAFKTGITLVLLCAALAQVAVGQEWVQCSNTPKAGGIGQAVCGTGDYLYIMRGYSTGRCHFWRYDPETNGWATLLEWSPPKTVPFNPIPRPKSGTALAWDGHDRIYVLFGGAGSDSCRAFFYSYEISTGIWSRLTDSPHAQGAGDALTWSGYDDAVYAILGSDKRGSTLARYVLKTGMWEPLSLNPRWKCTDDGASLAWTGGQYLYALNGEWEDTRAPHNDFACYDTQTGVWQDLAPIPEMDSTGGSAGVGDGASLLWIGGWDDTKADYIYALGGGGYGEVPGHSFYRYQISTGGWETLPILCSVGEWTGNRLGYAGGHIYCWQGNKSSSECGGSALLRWEPPDAARIVALEAQVRELCDTIDYLRHDVEDLEDELEELQDRVEDLEDQLEAIKD